MCILTAGHAFIHIDRNTYMQERTHIQAHAYRNRYVHMYTHAYISACIYAHINTQNIHADIHIHTYSSTGKRTEKHTGVQNIRIQEYIHIWVHTIVCTSRCVSKISLLSKCNRRLWQSQKRYASGLLRWNHMEIKSRMKKSKRREKSCSFKLVCSTMQNQRPIENMHSSQNISQNSCWSMCVLWWTLKPWISPQFECTNGNFHFCTSHVTCICNVLCNCSQSEFAAACLKVSMGMSLPR